MEYRPLGRIGVQVSKLCLGAMMLGDWGTRDHDESIRIVHRALEAGINFVDSADVYSNGESEVIVDKALAGGRRDDVVLATKVHMPMGEDPNRRGNSPRWIIREAEESLRRLGTDWIDLAVHLRAAAGLDPHPRHQPRGASGRWRWRSSRCRRSLPRLGDSLGAAHQLGDAAARNT
jgi:aryl-alcohol dehydrogenase-like predicted oxidoreductase